MRTYSQYINFYPFGSVMNTRNWSASSYRYGFNGKEKDDEINVEGGSYDFGARIYDGRLGRWFSIDQLAAKYPFLTPYSFSKNNPVLCMDFDGRDWTISTSIDKEGNKTVTIKLTAAVVNNSSNTKLNINAFATKTADQIKSVYSGSYAETVIDHFEVEQNGLDNYNPKQYAVYKSVKTTIKVEVEVRVIESESNLRPTEHLISIEDDDNDKMSKTENAHANKLGGKKVFVKEKTARGMINGNNSRTMAHEFGHTLNLKHNNWSKNNLMSSLYSKIATKLNIGQQKEIQKNIKNGKVNL